MVDAIFPGKWVGDQDAGTVEISGDGTSLVFTPKEGFDGTATFTYTVFDELRGEQQATVTITVTVELGEVVLESPDSPAVSQPEPPVYEPVAATTELIGPSGEPDAPIQAVEPMLIILPDPGSGRIPTRARATASSHHVEVVFDSLSPSLYQPGRAVSFVRDDIFDTFHAVRSGSVDDIEVELFSELAVEFAGVE